MPVLLVSAIKQNLASKTRLWYRSGLEEEHYGAK
jgi:hypothetical protein